MKLVHLVGFITKKPVGQYLTTGSSLMALRQRAY